MQLVLLLINHLHNTSSASEISVLIVLGVTYTSIRNVEICSSHLKVTQQLPADTFIK